MKKHEEALKRLKEIQAKLLAGNQAPDQVAALQREFMEGVIANMEKAKPSPRRRMSFQQGDPGFQESEFMASLPADVQKQIDAAIIAAKIMGRRVEETKTWQKLVDGSDILKKTDAFNAGTTGEGSDWVPTMVSPNFIEEITQFAGIEQILQHIVMPSNPYVVPVQLGRLTVYKVSEQTTNTGQTAGTKSAAAGVTDKLTLTASGIQGEVLVSKNLEEDSIVAMMPFLRKEIIKSLARGIEEATINGDTTATHQDSDTTGSDDRRKLWKGLRKHALANGYKVDFAAAGNGFDFETHMKVRAKLGKYGVTPGDLFWVTGLNEYFKMLSLRLSGGYPMVQTVDKYGPGATVVTGELGKLAGSRLLVSEFSREDLDVTGVYSGAGNTQGSIVCCYAPGFVYGDRRDTTMQLLTELYAEYQQDALLITMRKDFEPVRAIASNAAVAIGYDVATA